MFGCTGSSLLCPDFLQLQQTVAILCCRAWASHCTGFSCCRAWASECGLSSCDAGFQLPCGTWHLCSPTIVVASLIAEHGLQVCRLQQLQHVGSVVEAPRSQSRIKPASPALDGRFLTSELPEKTSSQLLSFKILFIVRKALSSLNKGNTLNSFGLKNKTVSKGIH